ncbi:MAG: branched-chain amino acid ABC transporter substrate-binding protein, partial [Gammaproteobacteria bacterium]
MAILNENTLWGTDVSDLENQYAEEYGYDVVANIPYEAESTEVSSEV